MVDTPGVDKHIEAQREDPVSCCDRVTGVKSSWISQSTRDPILLQFLV